MQKPFPLRGVIGVVANSPDEINSATVKGLQCVEIRADLLLDTGLSEAQLMTCVTHAKNSGLGTLFTLRHPTHGGKFTGNERERLRINESAIKAGADIIDLEWDSDAAKEWLTGEQPIILSYHDFNSMPATTDLDTLTAKMQSTGADAIKVVPTASSVSDSVTMLQWVAAASADVQRIGFAMGSAGACSRILTLGHGAPITYATFAEAVAPGQIDIDELLNSYRAKQINDETTVIAVCADKKTLDENIPALNTDLAQREENTVAIGFPAEAQTELEHAMDTLRLSEIRVL